jgi:hypothetical protein
MESSYYRDSKGQSARALAQCVAFWHRALFYLGLPLAEIRALVCQAVILSPQFLLADEPAAAGRSGPFCRETAGRDQHDSERALS